MSSILSEVLSVAETAALLGCSERKVEDSARSGDLPGLLYGDGGWIFPRDALLSRLTEKALSAAEARRLEAMPTPTSIQIPLPEAKAPGRKSNPLPKLEAA